MTDKKLCKKSSDSFGERAVRLIHKRPEVFEALLEFERTKKLPKIVSK